MADQDQLGMRSSIEAKRATFKRLPVRSCPKLPYPSSYQTGLALLAIRRSSPAGKRLPEALYPCELCHSWHITSDLKSRRNKWTRRFLVQGGK